MENNTLVRIGKILKPHGVRGTLKVMPMTDDKSRYDYLKEVYIQTRHGVKLFRVLGARYQEKFVLLDLEEINSMNDAEAYVGNFLAIEKKDRMPLAEDSYYIDDLIGLEVYEDGECLGKLIDVMQPGANDVYVVALENGKELLLPVIKSVIKKIDLSEKKIIVEVPKGLMD